VNTLKINALYYLSRLNTARKAYSCDDSLTSKEWLKGLRTPLRLLNYLLFLLATLLFHTATAAINDDNLLILDLQLNGRTIGSELIGYRDGSATLLPLGALIEALEFPIELDHSRGRGEGWFIDEGRRFQLDTAARQVVTDGRDLPLPDGSVVLKDNEIYVDSLLLSEWFPIDFKLNFSQQKVELQPRETLPIQARQLRLEGNRPAHLRERNLTQHPRQSLPYQTTSIPTTDIDLSYTISRPELRGKPQASSRHSIITSGDLAYMTSHFYLSGSDTDLLESARLSLQRTDPNSGLLGPLHASRFIMGDINAVRIPLYSVSAFERGLRVENDDDTRAHSFDTTDFSGDLLPNWEVELYRNSILVAYTVIGSNGRYQLDDVPLYFGNNEFELIFYGPNGQIRRTVRSHHVGPGMLQPGKTLYRFSLTEKDRQLFELGAEQTPRSGRSSGRLVGLIEHGVSQSLSVAAGLHSVEFNDERHSYINLGLRSVLPGMFASFDTTADTAGGESYSVLLQKALQGANLRAHATLYNNYVSEDDFDLNDPLISTSSISLRTQIGNMPLLFSLEDSRREQSSETLFRNSISARLFDSYLSHDLKLLHRHTGTTRNSLTQGALQISKHFDPLFVRSRLDYTLYPELDIDALFISGLLNIDDRLSMNVDLTHNIGNENFNEFSAGLNWKTSSLIVTPSLSYNSNGLYTGMISANLSLGAEPESEQLYLDSERQTSKGSVAAMVFEDRNGNGQFDQGERSIPDVLVRAIQGNRGAITNSEGIAFITELPVDIKSDIEIDKVSFKEPFLTQRHTDRSIVPRSGTTAEINLPMIPTGEIDGTLYELDSDGMRRELANITIRLHDREQQLVASQRTAFDGFFLFSDIPLGSYTLSIEPSHAARLVEQAPPLTLTDRGEVIDGIVLLLDVKPTLDARPEVLDKPTPTAVNIQPVAPISAANSNQPVTVERPHPVTVPATISKQMPRAVTGDMSLQLGSFQSKVQAEDNWLALNNRLPQAVNWSDMQIIKADLGSKGVYFRIFANHGITRQAARALCREVKAVNGVCMPITTPGELMPDAKASTDKLFKVQLGAFSTIAAAQRAWHIINSQLEEQLQSYRHQVYAHTSDRGTLYRLALVPEIPEQQARTLCNQLKQQGRSCFISN